VVQDMWTRIKRWLPLTQTGYAYTTLPALQSAALRDHGVVAVLNALNVQLYESSPGEVFLEVCRSFGDDDGRATDSLCLANQENPRFGSTGYSHIAMLDWRDFYPSLKESMPHEYLVFDTEGGGCIAIGPSPAGVYNAHHMSGPRIEAIYKNGRRISEASEFTCHTSQRRELLGSGVPNHPSSVHMASYGGLARSVLVEYFCGDERDSARVAQGCWWRDDSDYLPSQYVAGGFAALEESVRRLDERWQQGRVHLSSSSNAEIAVVGHLRRVVLALEIVGESLSVKALQRDVEEALFKVWRAESEEQHRLEYGNLVSALRQITQSVRDRISPVVSKW